MTLPTLVCSDRLQSPSAGEGVPAVLTQLICLTGGLRAGTLAVGTAAMVRGIRRCGLYNFYFTENAILCGVYACAGYTRMRRICAKILYTNWL